MPDTRTIASLPLSPSLIGLLTTAGFRTASDILELGPLDLSRGLPTVLLTSSSLITHRGENYYRGCSGNLSIYLQNKVFSLFIYFIFLLFLIQVTSVQKMTMLALRTMSATIHPLQPSRLLQSVQTHWIY